MHELTNEHWYMSLITKIKASPDKEVKMEQLNHKLHEGIVKMEEVDPEGGILLQLDLESVMYGHHLTEMLYEKGVETLVNSDDTKGPHWSVVDVYDTAGMDLGSKRYNKYDLAWMVNWFYSDFAPVLGEEPSTYIQMAVASLEDKDYYGMPCERAYHSVMERLHRYKNYHKK